jgi:integrase
VKIHYFEKRAGAWHLDFKTADGVRRRPYGGKTKDEAERKAPEVIAKTLNELPTIPTSRTLPDADLPGTTLQEAFDLASRTREKWLTSKDKEAIQTTFDMCMGPTLQPTDPCSKLTRKFVQALRLQWMNEDGKRKGTKLSPSTINHRLSMLSVLLETVDFPPHNVKHLSTKGNSRKRRVTDAEIDAARSWCYANAERKDVLELADLITCGIGTGARESELLDLQWKHVAATTLTFADTKNSLSRTIPLRPAVKAVLEARRHLPKPFPGLTTDRITKLWADMRKDTGKAGDHEFVFHLLRHESVNRMIDEGKSTLAIQAWHGHESVTTTEGYASVGLTALRLLANLAPLELVA